MNAADPSPIPRFFWLWLVLAFIAVQVVLEATLSPTVLTVLMSETGPHELLQFTVIAGAFIVALMTLRLIDARRQPWLFAWVAVAALCAFYVAGEEITWGQRVFGWVTPEYWAQISDQNETNLHNTSSWLDQKPRVLLEIGIAVGGIIIPLVQRFRPQALPARFAVIYPDRRLFVTAAAAIGLKQADTFAKMFDIRLFERVSEVQELLFFYFVLLYLLFLKDRLVRRQEGIPASPETNSQL